MNKSGEVAALLEDDAPRPDGADRYAIYSRSHTGNRRRLAETNQRGIGLCLITLADEGEITSDDPIGILDRVERRWVVNPWAVGR